MTRISYFVPRFHNIGDKLVWVGAMAHYGRIYPNAEHRMVSMSDPPTEPFETDVFVVVGQPWLWDQCCRTKKYRTLRAVIDLCKCHRREAIGIGASYPLAWEDYRFLKYQHDEECHILRKVWRQFDRIAVRDHLAKEMFDILGVPCVHEPCPSHLAADYLGVKPGPRGENLLVYYDLMAGTGHETMGEQQAQAWSRLVLDAVERYRIKDVICVCGHEVEAAAAIGLKAESFQEAAVDSDDTTSIRRLLERLAVAGDVVSGRVHAAIPAKTLGRRVVVLPVDSRHHTTGLPTYYDENPNERRWHEC